MNETFPSAHEPVYDYILRAKWSIDGATNLGEISEKLIALAKQVDEMRLAGVYMLKDAVVQDDYAILYTNDPVVAREFGFTKLNDEEIGEDPDDELGEADPAGK